MKDYQELHGSTKALSIAQVICGVCVHVASVQGLQELEKALVSEKDWQKGQRQRMTVMTCPLSLLGGPTSGLLSAVDLVPVSLDAPPSPQKVCQQCRLSVGQAQAGNAEFMWVQRANGTHANSTEGANGCDEKFVVSSGEGEDSDAIDTLATFKLPAMPVSICMFFA